MYPIRKSSRTDKSKYYDFHKSHYHKTNNCIQLKDVIERMINKWRLTKCTKDDKRVQEDSLKKKQSPKKLVEDVARGKGKNMSIGGIRKERLEVRIHCFHHKRRLKGKQLVQRHNE